MVQHLERRHTYRRFLFFAQAETNPNRDLFTLHAHSSSRQNSHKFCAERTQSDPFLLGQKEGTSAVNRAKGDRRCWNVFWATFTPHIIIAAPGRNEPQYQPGLDDSHVRVSVKTVVSFFFKKK